MVYGKHPLILYGTETGTARDASKLLVEILRICNLKPRIMSFDDFPFENILDEPFIIFVIATSGQGQMPSNSRKNWHKLLTKTLPKDFLSNLNFAVAALGDSSYVEYNFAGKKLYRRLLSLGAKPLVNIALCDDQHQQGMDAGLETFKNDLLEALISQYPEMEPYDDEKLLPPTYNIHYVDDVESEKITDVEVKIRRESENEKKRGSCFEKLRVIENKKVTAEGHFQDTYLISLENDKFDYKPGDVAHIQPENLDEVVELAISSLNISDEQLKKPFYLEVTDDCLSLPPSYLITYPTTLYQCFKVLFDINSLPTRQFFKQLSKLAVHEMEKERLNELSDYNSFDDFLDYIRFPRRSIAEVLRDFHNTSKDIPVERYFDIFPFIRPRSFSICSSHLSTPNILQIIVARVELKRKNMRTTRMGLCSNYLSRLKEGDVIPVKIQDGTMDFDVPEGWTRVCIATGTGIAPFRNLIAEQSKKDDPYPIILFFGCRSKNLDNYFGDEWHKYNNLVVFHAFSRDTAAKVYVQHMMEENDGLLQRLIRSGRVKFYIAGSSGEMPKAIRSTLKSIIQDGGISSDPDEMLNKMELARFGMDIKTELNHGDDLLSPFLTREAIDIALKLNWIIIKIICTFLGVVSFCITTNLIDFDIKNVISKLQRKTPKEIEYDKLSAELTELKTELASMSEMDEFANYHRKRRVILKLQDQVDAIGSSTQKQRLYESMKLLLVFKFLIFLMGFFFSYFTRDVIVSRIPGNYVWPFGFFLTWPWIFQANDSDGYISVTLFNLLMLISIINAAYHKQLKKQTDLYVRHDQKKTN